MCTLRLSLAAAAVKPVLQKVLKFHFITSFKGKHLSRTWEHEAETHSCIIVLTWAILQGWGV